MTVTATPAARVVVSGNVDSRCDRATSGAAVPEPSAISFQLSAISKVSAVGLSSLRGPNGSGAQRRRDQSDLVAISVAIGGGFDFGRQRGDIDLAQLRQLCFDPGGMVC